MSEKRFKKGDWTNCRYDICEIIDEDDEVVCIVSLNDADKVIAILEENEQLKSQLYSDDEEGVCNICKHHYLVKDNEIELGYYNSRCRKGHYECARVSLKYCEDFEKELGE